MVERAKELPIKDEKAKEYIKHNSYVDKNGCWIWSGSVDIGGYGKANWNGNHNIKAHRLSYSAFNRQIQKNNIIMHRCDNRLCVNPNHLIQGSYRDNIIDMHRKDRAGILKGCKHPLSKVSNEDVREIRILYEKGMTQRQIASLFEIKQTTVGKIVRGERYISAGGPVIRKRFDIRRNKNGNKRRY
jgi:hypothetical protein